MDASDIKSFIGSFYKGFLAITLIFSLNTNNNCHFAVFSNLICSFFKK